MPNLTRLYYSHDPMCSFCWAFRPVWAEIQSTLADKKPDIEIISILGGLAPDSDEPMPEEVKHRVRAAWQYIEQNIPGTQFNYDFWHLQKPRRSTYPSCRAVIAVRILDPGLEATMVMAIQHAYYKEAQNPSDENTLVACAESIGLDATQFTQTLHSQACVQIFEQDRMRSHSLGIGGFPSLVITRGNSQFAIPVDYTDATAVLNKLSEAVSLL